MKVRELIAKLQEEDPEATAVVVLSKYRYDRLSELKAMDRGIFDELKVDGKDSFGPSVVIVADRS